MSSGSSDTGHSDGVSAFGSDGSTIRHSETYFSGVASGDSQSPITSRDSSYLSNDASGFIPPVPTALHGTMSGDKKTIKSQSFDSTNLSSGKQNTISENIADGNLVSTEYRGAAEVIGGTGARKSELRTENSNTFNNEISGNIGDAGARISGLHAENSISNNEMSGISGDAPAWIHTKNIISENKVVSNTISEASARNLGPGLSNVVNGSVTANVRPDATLSPEGHMVRNKDNEIVVQNSANHQFIKPADSVTYQTDRAAATDVRSSATGYSPEITTTTNTGNRGWQHSSTFQSTSFVTSDNSHSDPSVTNGGEYITMQPDLAGSGVKRLTHSSFQQPGSATHLSSNVVSNGLQENIQDSTYTNTIHESSTAGSVDPPTTDNAVKATEFTKMASGKQVSTQMVRVVDVPNEIREPPDMANPPDFNQPTTSGALLHRGEQNSVDMQSLVAFSGIQSTTDTTHQQDTTGSTSTTGGFNMAGENMSNTGEYQSMTTSDVHSSINTETGASAAGTGDIHINYAGLGTATASSIPGDRPSETLVKSSGNQHKVDMASLEALTEVRSVMETHHKDITAQNEGMDKTHNNPEVFIDSHVMNSHGSVDSRTGDTHSIVNTDAVTPGDQLATNQQTFVDYHSMTTNGSFMNTWPADTHNSTNSADHLSTNQQTFVEYHDATSVGTNNNMNTGAVNYQMNRNTGLPADHLSYNQQTFVKYQDATANGAHIDMNAGTTDSHLNSNTGSQADHVLSNLPNVVEYHDATTSGTRMDMNAGTSDLQMNTNTGVHADHMSTNPETIVEYHDATTSGAHLDMNAGTADSQINTMTGSQAAEYTPSTQTNIVKYHDGSMGGIHTNTETVNIGTSSPDTSPVLDRYTTVDSRTVQNSDPVIQNLIDVPASDPKRSLQEGTMNEVSMTKLSSEASVQHPEHFIDTGKSISYIDNVESNTPTEKVGGGMNTNNVNTWSTHTITQVHNSADTSQGQGGSANELDVSTGNGAGSIPTEKTSFHSGTDSTSHGKRPSHAESTYQQTDMISGHGTEPGGILQTTQYQRDANRVDTEFTQTSSKLGGTLSGQSLDTGLVEPSMNPGQALETNTRDSSHRQNVVASGHVVNTGPEDLSQKTVASGRGVDSGLVEISHYKMDLTSGNSVDVGPTELPQQGGPMIGDTGTNANAGHVDTSSAYTTDFTMAQGNGNTVDRIMTSSSSVSDTQTNVEYGSNNIPLSDNIQRQAVDMASLNALTEVRSTTGTSGTGMATESPFSNTEEPRNTQYDTGNQFETTGTRTTQFETVETLSGQFDTTGTHTGQAESLGTTNSKMGGLSGKHLETTGTHVSQFERTGTPTNHFENTESKTSNFESAGTTSNLLQSGEMLGIDTTTGTHVSQFESTGTSTSHLDNTGVQTNHLANFGTANNILQTGGMSNNQYETTGTTSQFEAAGTPRNQLDKTGAPVTQFEAIPTEHYVRSPSVTDTGEAISSHFDTHYKIPGVDEQLKDGNSVSMNFGNTVESVAMSPDTTNAGNNLDMQSQLGNNDAMITPESQRVTSHTSGHQTDPLTDQTLPGTYVASDTITLSDQDAMTIYTLIKQLIDRAGRPDLVPVLDSIIASGKDIDRSRLMSFLDTISALVNRSQLLTITNIMTSGRSGGNNQLATVGNSQANTRQTGADTVVMHSTGDKSSKFDIVNNSGGSSGSVVTTVTNHFDQQSSSGQQANTDIGSTVISGDQGIGKSNAVAFSSSGNTNTLKTAYDTLTTDANIGRSSQGHAGDVGNTEIAGSHTSIIWESSNGNVEKQPTRHTSNTITSNYLPTDSPGTGTGVDTTLSAMHTSFQSSTSSGTATSNSDVDIGKVGNNFMSSNSSFESSSTASGNNIVPKERETFVITGSRSQTEETARTTYIPTTNNVLGNEHQSTTTITSTKGIQGSNGQVTSEPNTFYTTPSGFNAETASDAGNVNSVYAHNNFLLHKPESPVGTVPGSMSIIESKGTDFVTHDLPRGGGFVAVDKSRVDGNKLVVPGAPDASLRTGVDHFLETQRAINSLDSFTSNSRLNTASPSKENYIGMTATGNSDTISGVQDGQFTTLFDETSSGGHTSKIGITGESTYVNTGGNSHIRGSGSVVTEQSSSTSGNVGIHRSPALSSQTVDSLGTIETSPVGGSQFNSRSTQTETAIQYHGGSTLTDSGSQLVGGSKETETGSQYHGGSTLTETVSQLDSGSTGTETGSQYHGGSTLTDSGSQLVGGSTGTETGSQYHGGSTLTETVSQLDSGSTGTETGSQYHGESTLTETNSGSQLVGGSTGTETGSQYHGGSTLTETVSQLDSGSTGTETGSQSTLTETVSQLDGGSTGIESGSQYHGGSTLTDSGSQLVGGSTGSETGIKYHGGSTLKTTASQLFDESTGTGNQLVGGSTGPETGSQYHGGSTLTETVSQMNGGSTGIEPGSHYHSGSTLTETVNQLDSGSTGTETGSQYHGGSTLTETVSQMNGGSTGIEPGSHYHSGSTLTETVSQLVGGSTGMEFGNQYHGGPTLTDKGSHLVGGSTGMETGSQYHGGSTLAETVSQLDGGSTGSETGIKYHGGSTLKSTASQLVGESTETGKQLVVGSTGIEPGNNNYGGSTLTETVSQLVGGSTGMASGSQYHGGSTLTDSGSQLVGGTTGTETGSQYHGGSTLIETVSQLDGGTTGIESGSQYHGGSTLTDSGSQLVGGSTGTETGSQYHGGSTLTETVSQLDSGSTGIESGSQYHGGSTLTDSGSQLVGGSTGMETGSQYHSGSTLTEAASQLDGGLTGIESGSQYHGGSTLTETVSQLVEGSTGTGSQFNGGLAQTETGIQYHGGSTMTETGNQLDGGTTGTEPGSQYHGRSTLTKTVSQRFGGPTGTETGSQYHGGSTLTDTGNQLVGESIGTVHSSSTSGNVDTVQSPAHSSQSVNTVRYTEETRTVAEGKSPSGSGGSTLVESADLLNSGNRLPVSAPLTDQRGDSVLFETGSQQSIESTKTDTGNSAQGQPQVALNEANRVSIETRRVSVSGKSALPKTEAFKSHISSDVGGTMHDTLASGNAVMQEHSLFTGNGGGIADMNTNMLEFVPRENSHTSSNSISVKTARTGYSVLDGGSSLMPGYSNNEFQTVVGADMHKNMLETAPTSPMVGGGRVSGGEYLTGAEGSLNNGSAITETVNQFQSGSTLTETGSQLTGEPTEVTMGNQLAGGSTGAEAVIKYHGGATLAEGGSQVVSGSTEAGSQFNGGSMKIETGSQNHGRSTLKETGHQLVGGSTGIESGIQYHGGSTERAGQVLGRSTGTGGRFIDGTKQMDTGNQYHVGSTLTEIKTGSTVTKGESQLVGGSTGTGSQLNGGSTMIESGSQLVGESIGADPGSQYHDGTTLTETGIQLVGESTGSGSQFTGGSADSSHFTSGSAGSHLVGSIGSALTKTHSNSGSTMTGTGSQLNGGSIEISKLTEVLSGRLAGSSVSNELGGQFGGEALSITSNQGVSNTAFGSGSLNGGVNRLDGNKEGTGSTNIRTSFKTTQTVESNAQADTLPVNSINSLGYDIGTPNSLGNGMENSYAKSSGNNVLFREGIIPSTAGSTSFGNAWNGEQSRGLHDSVNGGTRVITQTASARTLKPSSLSDLPPPPHSFLIPEPVHHLLVKTQRTSTRSSLPTSSTFVQPSSGSSFDRVFGNGAKARQQNNKENVLNTKTQIITKSPSSSQSSWLDNTLGSGLQAPSSKTAEGVIRSSSSSSFNTGSSSTPQKNTDSNLLRDFISRRQLLSNARALANVGILRGGAADISSILKSFADAGSSNTILSGRTRAKTAVSLDSPMSVKSLVTSRSTHNQFNSPARSTAERVRLENILNGRMTTNIPSLTSNMVSASPTEYVGTTKTSSRFTTSGLPPITSGLNSVMTALMKNGPGIPAQNLGGSVIGISGSKASGADLSSNGIQLSGVESATSAGKNFQIYGSQNNPDIIKQQEGSSSLTGSGGSGGIALTNGGSSWRSGNVDSLSAVNQNSGGSKFTDLKTIMGTTKHENVGRTTTTTTQTKSGNLGGSGGSTTTITTRTTNSPGSAAFHKGGTLANAGLSSDGFQFTVSSTTVISGQESQSVCPGQSLMCGAKGDFSNTIGSNLWCINSCLIDRRMCRSAKCECSCTTTLRYLQQVGGISSTISGGSSGSGLLNSGSRVFESSRSFQTQNPFGNIKSFRKSGRTAIPLGTANSVRTTETFKTTKSFGNTKRSPALQNSFGNGFSGSNIFHSSVSGSSRGSVVGGSSSSSGKRQKSSGITISSGQRMVCKGKGAFETVAGMVSWCETKCSMTKDIKCHPNTCECSYVTGG
ncbi:serine-rich adhesin for platelets-like [Pecten maximus]|uniref:serine-rich adhesin for platelets-like n=1 Tax=Pecten maximus TaxID=6579 RepID=UPI001457F648|nr:serine-rich adhesin for platelets-like [Pecten maximus]